MILVGSRMTSLKRTLMMSEVFCSRSQHSRLVSERRILCTIYSLLHDSSLVGPVVLCCRRFDANPVPAPLVQITEKWNYINNAVARG